MKHAGGMSGRDAADPTLLAPRPYADPEAAALRLLEIANEVEAWQGRIYIELINGPFLFRDRGSAPEFHAGLNLLLERKQLLMHESGAYVSLPDTGGLSSQAEQT